MGNRVSKRERMQRRVETAMLLLSQKDPGELRVVDIMREAGISNGTFYNYYASKEEVREALFRRVQHAIFASIESGAITATEIESWLQSVLRAFLKDLAIDRHAAGLIAGSRSISALVEFPATGSPVGSTLADGKGALPDGGAMQRVGDIVRLAFSFVLRDTTWADQRGMDPQVMDRRTVLSRGLNP